MIVKNLKLISSSKLYINSFDLCRVVHKEIRMWIWILEIGQLCIYQNALRKYTEQNYVLFSNGYGLEDQVRNKRYIVIFVNL